ncbi:hypothetical protein tpqmel_0693 [Candidatus Gastranaerophilus sp. (ex Termes propinquus)]|nr:hypothetical protein tpqmel_0693 [Candidatus Gastranaerophilus sp. (ex Termes propinquus)]
MALLSNYSPDTYAVVNVLKKTAPAICALGLLGWLIGTVFDNRRIKKKQLLSSGDSSAQSVEGEEDAQEEEGVQNEG